MLYWLANHNFGLDWMSIRRLQCWIFGHNHFTWVTDYGTKKISWCGWCSQETEKYPRFRRRIER